MHKKNASKSVFVPRNGIFFTVLNNFKTVENRLETNNTKTLTQFEQK
jgi:hypothetical protein